MDVYVSFWISTISKQSLSILSEWVGAGYNLNLLPEDYLASEADSYNHPNAAIEPRIPGIFQYYSIAEDELAKIYAGQYGCSNRCR